MLSVEIRDAAKAAVGMAEIEIFCDAEGPALLLRQLGHLRKGASHIHLMTPAWAGNELDEEALGEGTRLVNHLKITMLAREKKAKATKFDPKQK